MQPYGYVIRRWKIEALMDLKHAPRKKVLDNLTKTAPLTLPWDQMDKQYTREFVSSLAWYTIMFLKYLSVTVC